MANVKPLNLQPIPATRKVRRDTDLKRYVLDDQEDVKKAARVWVRETARAALVEAIAAGNPKVYITEVK